MPTAPPATQPSWLTVSERAKVEVRTTSGTSRWMTASSASLPRDAVRLPISAMASAVHRPKKAAVTTEASVLTIRHSASRVSGAAVESRLPTAVPRMPPAPAATTSTLSAKPSLSVTESGGSG